MNILNFDSFYSFVRLIYTNFMDLRLYFIWQSIKNNVVLKIRHF